MIHFSVTLAHPEYYLKITLRDESININSIRIITTIHNNKIMLWYNNYY